MLLGVDVGGTFTDAVLLGQGGELYSAKAATTPNQADGVIAAIDCVLTAAAARAGQVRSFSHGMTVATNALIEGRTARTALVGTAGFSDIVELARQARPRLYDLCAAAPAPLVAPALRFEAPERMTPAGPLQPLLASACERLLNDLAASRPEAIAVVLLHAYAHPEHELALGELIQQRLPDVHVSLSHELVGTFREYERAATTEIDAALSPLLSRYLRRLCARAHDIELPEPRIMQSSGGLADAAQAGAHAAVTLLSGPAGGVAAALMLARASGERDVLCFDIGGTSCDVSAISEGTIAETAARELAGHPLALPTLDIHTVGAGGGSIAWRDPGGALRVGPRSAGASPGPACYGNGATAATLTDANLLLGRLHLQTPLADGRRLDLSAARTAVVLLAEELGLDALRCAEGIVAVAEAEMLRALHTMTVERGLDPRDFTLLAYGGAGPLHVCSLAEQLGARRALCPRSAGVLSALGLAGAPVRRDRAKTVMLRDSQLTDERLREELLALIERLLGELGEVPQRLRLRHELRYVGQSFELAVDHEPACPGDRAEAGDWLSDAPSATRLRRAFDVQHEQRYGYSDPAGAVELVTLRLSAWGSTPTVAPRGGGIARAAVGDCELWLRGHRVRAALWRGEPALGARLTGPALCCLPDSTLLIADGWSGEVDEHATIRLTRD